MEMNNVDIENNINKLNVNNTLYGINNEVYTIESIKDNQINVIYYRKLHITYNLGNNQETRINEEHISFFIEDIGIKIFFKDGDCYKTIDELYKDKDYLKYNENLQNRVKMDEEKEQKRLEYIESLRPNSKKITSEDIDLILSSYSDEEKSLKEEKDFYDYSQKNNISYFARMDLNTEYEKENYYEKFYIAKDTKPIEIEDGITKKKHIRIELENVSNGSCIRLEYFGDKENLIYIHGEDNSNNMFKKGTTYYFKKYED